MASGQKPGGDCSRRPARPPQSSDKLNAALKTALEDKALQTSLAAQGDEVAYSTAQDFAHFVETETKKWTQVVKSADLKVD